MNVFTGLRSGLAPILSAFGNAGFRFIAPAAVLFVATCTLLPSANALPNFPDVVSKAYTLKADGVVSKASTACTLCHVDAGPPKLNPYGKDVKVAMETAHAKDLTPAILHSIDSKDSDGDGANNGMEIAADTLPGDPASKPAGTVAPAGAPTPTADAASAEDHSLVGTVLKLAFPKHAQHPVLVHFPIGLFFISVIFDVLAIWRKDRNLALAAYYNLAAGGITAVLSVGSGLLAWWFAFGHEAFNKDTNLLYHLVLGITTTVLIGILWGIRFRAKDRAAKPTTAYMVLALIALLVISVTGHLGGNLTGVN